MSLKGSAKYIPYLYNRIKTVVLSLVNNQIIPDRDTVQISCDYQGNNEDFTNSTVNFKVFYSGGDVTSSWTIYVYSVTNCTINQVGNAVSVTAISADEASYTVRASRSGYTVIDKVIQVSKVKDGADGAGVPIGGTTGQSLVKASNTDQDVTWATINTAGIYQDSGLEYLVPYSENGQGDTRGNNAIDLQMTRSTSSEVASGNQSFIAGGYYNTASGGSSAVSGGYSNQAVGENSGCIGGFSNTTSVTGIDGFVGGGNNNTSSGSDSAVVGGVSNTASGDRGFATGSLNEAHDYSETVVGVYATVSTGNQLTNTSGNTVFKVGSGTGAGSRSDALSVTNDGIITINNILDITPQASAPTGVEGRVYYDSTTHKLMCFDGTSWVALW